MLKVYLTLFVLAAAAFAESLRETETWVPEKKVVVPEEASGDFGFSEEEPTTFEDDDDEDDTDYNEGFDDMSGSGDVEIDEDIIKIVEPEEMDNHIPEEKFPVQPWPTEDERSLVDQNKIAPVRLMPHAGEQNIFNKKEVLAAVIAGGAVGLLFAILLILLLVYRMKKKDEGSYDLGKKPIYKKAPTAEIYA